MVGARGIKGEVRVKSFTADPADLGSYGPLTDEAGTRRFSLKVKALAKGLVIARIEGIADRTAAEALKGTGLYVARDALPAPADEEEFYHWDLVGLRVELEDGRPLGQVKAVHDFGAGTVLELAGEESKGLMLPFTRAVVPVVDLAAGRLVVVPPPGLLEPAPPEAMRDGGKE